MEFKITFSQYNEYKDKALYKQLGLPFDEDGYVDLFDFDNFKGIESDNWPTVNINSIEDLISFSNYVGGHDLIISQKEKTIEVYNGYRE